MVELAVCLVFLLPATAACLYYLVPTVVGVWRRAHAPRPVAQPRHTFAILIPAHDEQTTLPATLRSVARLDYPPGRLRVFVVADNCTDRTAEVAAAAGVGCLVRTDPDRTGKGYAIAFGLRRVLKEKPDAVLTLDADCELNREALRELDAALAAGADAVQAAVRSRNADGPTGYVAAVGAAVDRAVAAGLDRLGVSVPLRGTAMAFRRSVLERVPWEAFGAVEDAEYADRLRAARVRVRFAGGAVVSCDAPADLWTQRRRWRSAARGRLVRSKPLVLAHLAVTAAVAAGSGLTCALIWAAVLVALTAGIYLRAVAEVGCRPRLLASAPLVVARLGWLTLGGLFRGPPTAWVRTPRPAEGRPA
jgi:cellulose synthase/poly-beta-1,6-N-acetylglucosamine synthase-like glycosyltransferase